MKTTMYNEIQRIEADYHILPRDLS